MSSRWQGIDWRLHRSTIPVAGSEVNFVEFGSGRPIIFLHGLGGCWQNWLGNIHHFATTNRVIALDLPGFGRSTCPADGQLTIDGYVEFLVSFCNRLGIDRTTLVGSSMGGLIATRTAIHHPSLVENLVLVSSAGLNRRELARGPLPWIARALQLYAVALPQTRQAIAQRARMRKFTMGLVIKHPELLSPAVAFELMLGAGTPGFRTALRSLLKHSVAEHAHLVRCPTLIVWGEHDRVIPVSNAYRFAELIPGAQTKIMAESSHLPMIEQPEEFNAALSAFLQSCTGSERQPLILPADEPAATG